MATAIVPQPSGEDPEFTIQDRLRKARELAGYTQPALADAIGVARQTISNYEAGHTTHQRRIVLNQWAIACGVRVEWLRTGLPEGHTPDGPGDQGVTGSGCYADVVTLRAA